MSRRSWFGAACLGLTAVSAILQPAARAAAPAKAIATLDPSLDALVLTHDAGDSYALSTSGGVIKASTPPSNTGGNTRVVFWRRADKPAEDAQSCGTWQSSTRSIDQEGAVLRVATVRGVSRAITVTKNVFFGANYVFNVHLWDTSVSPVPFTLIAQFNLKSVFVRGGKLVPFPWRMCAQVFANTVSFIAWPANEPQPGWGDTSHGGSVTLPSGWDYVGATGWYVGHLQAADAVSYAGLGVGGPTLAGVVAAVPAMAGVHQAP